MPMPFEMLEVAAVISPLIRLTFLWWVEGDRAGQGRWDL